MKIVLVLFLVNFVALGQAVSAPQYSVDASPDLAFGKSVIHVAIKNSQAQPSPAFHVHVEVALGNAQTIEQAKPTTFDFSVPSIDAGQSLTRDFDVPDFRANLPAIENGSEVMQIKVNASYGAGAQAQTFGACVQVVGYEDIQAGKVGETWAPVECGRATAFIADRKARIAKWRGQQ